MDTISWQDFAKVELRLGRVARAERFDEAIKPAYTLQVDFRPESRVSKSKL